MYDRENMVFYLPFLKRIIIRNIMENKESWDKNMKDVEKHLNYNLIELKVKFPFFWIYAQV